MNIYLFQRILGIGVLILQIVIVGLISYLIYKKITGKSIKWLDSMFADYGIILAAGTAFFAIVGSLIFSDFYLVEPCKLCWVQRIFIYPQTLIMGIAAWKKDISAWTYSLWSSIIGLIIALYHTSQQFGVTVLPEIDCVIGPEAACSKIDMIEFGYITFPLASATLFLFIIILYILRKK